MFDPTRVQLHRQADSARRSTTLPRRFADVRRSSDGHDFSQLAVQPAANLGLDGRGPGGYAVGFAGGTSLKGLTTADFSKTTFSIRNRGVRVRAGTGCTDCEKSDCKRVTGTITSVFRVSTSVTLPKVDDFGDLRPCQREQVVKGIRTLATHEKKHVAAFNAYAGTVDTPFDFNMCQSELSPDPGSGYNRETQRIHDELDLARQDAANAASAALDPFQIDVDMSCEDKPKRK